MNKLYFAIHITLEGNFIPLQFNRLLNQKQILIPKLLLGNSQHSLSLRY